MAEGDRFPYTGNIPVRNFQHPPERVKNQFANDGSFLEMFKKRMEATTISTVISADDNNLESDIKNRKPTGVTITTTSNDKVMISPTTTGLSSRENLSDINNIRPTTTTIATTNTTLKSGSLPLVGKRRSDLRRSLKTGIVKKLKSDTSSDTADNSSMNASTKYMEEVKRYKATMCVEDEKCRPLVK